MKKYNINLDRPLMIISLILVSILLFRAYYLKDLFDLILVSTFYIAYLMLVLRDYPTSEPFATAVK